MRRYFYSDLIFRILKKLKDYILKMKWLLLLGSIGRGSFIRSGCRIIGNPRRIKIGKEFKIYQRAIISIGKGEILIGNRGLIGVGSYINCGDNKVIIGNNVAIAPFCKIFANSHYYSNDAPMTECFKNGDVIIGDNVLIGSNSIILPGVTIGSGSIIGAFSLVNKNIEPDNIVMGIPAKTFKAKSK